MTLDGDKVWNLPSTQLNSTQLNSCLFIGHKSSEEFCGWPAHQGEGDKVQGCEDAQVSIYNTLQIYLQLLTI